MSLLNQPLFQPGGRVGVIGRNDPGYLAAYLGILRAGGVVVPLNHMLRPEELSRSVEFADLSSCVTGEVDRDLAEVVASRCEVRSVAELEGPPGSPSLLQSSESDATILLTSGSTGTPKGVVHTHGSMLYAARRLLERFPFSKDDVNLAFLPFFAAIPEQILPVLFSGGTLEVLPRFDATAVSKACARATCFDAVPTVMARLLNHGDFGQLNRLRWVMFASEPMPASLLQWWWESVPNAKTYEFYGMTELLTISSASPELLQQDPATVGVPFPGSHVTVLDESDQPLPAGVEGQIACGSPGRMRGYFRDLVATEQALTAAGAMRTGDLGRMDERQRVFLTGRIKDLIISGGLNVSPAEIETVASRHPMVTSVCVVGIPDDDWGETPVVVAVPRRGSSLTARELLDYCRANLSRYKRPSAAALVDNLPMAGIGKAAKLTLRQAILEGKLRLERAD